MNSTICFDFDGVIATYSGWKGFDVLGKPNYEVIRAMQELKDKGKYIVIFTTRPATETLVKWLKDYNVPYDEINRNKHNPVMTSTKPIYSVIVDDRACRYKQQTTEELLRDIEVVLEETKNY